ncbi:MAG: diphthine--ammonia ligase, partial [Terriglobus roseus]|nr:diphthine--ammonia ligase [Terriglobus roseus]
MAANSLNVIALISGGKDSLFSILHCIANGHKVVALANLYPAAADDQNEDIDSYMYQTVGHSAIPLYEAALGIPIYRQPIAGSAVDHARDYRGPGSHEADDDDDDADETESLLPLLRRVKAAHPAANAVSSGAILSTYQRTRVESVALRAGLAPLAYLWQWPSLPPYAEAALLADMRAVGMDARIVKVAGGGLDEGALWGNVADARVTARLERAAARFGTPGDGAVVGEGGEFETLAVDGPGPLWKRRIQ